MSAWTLTLGDCLDPATGLAALADGSVDHVICDPPYTQRTSENARNRRDSQRRYVSFDGVDGLEVAIVRESLRVSRRWCVVFCALEQLGTYATAAGEDWVRAAVWHRTNSAPQFTGDRPGQACEGIAIFHRSGKKRWNCGGRSLIYVGGTINATNDPDRGTIDHPTTKPSWLMEQVVRDLTDPGDLICDPFAGSGTTGIAAIRLGRRFIGWERDPKYHEIATKRLSAAKEQGDLFRAAPKTKAKQETLL